MGALLTSVMLTFSPALFYFSRFARNDILMALFIAVLVVAMWRYIEEQRHRWFYIAAAALAFSMATKESAYIFVVIFAAYFAWTTRYEIIDVLLGHKKLSEISPQGHLLVLLIGLTAPFYAVSIAIFQDLFGLTLAAVEGTPGVVTGAPDGSTATAVAAGFTLLVFGVGVAIGAWWNWRRFWVALAIFLGDLCRGHDQIRKPLPRVSSRGYGNRSDIGLRSMMFVGAVSLGTTTSSSARSTSFCRC